MFFLEQRLKSEYGRVIRVIKRTEKVGGDLKNLLRIQDDGVGEIHLVSSQVAATCYRMD